MKKEEFKIGDKVKRTQDSWFGMHEGDIGTIAGFTNNNKTALYFKEFGGGHSYSKFVLFLDSGNNHYEIY